AAPLSDAAPRPSASTRSRRPSSASPTRPISARATSKRLNLSMRMSLRRYTRLTNGFSKRLENHVAALSLHFAHYNFCRVHKTLGTTPAVAAGITDHVWTLQELVDLLEAAENTPTHRGKYKPRANAARSN